MKKAVLVLLAFAPGILLGVSLCGCAGPSGSATLPDSAVPGHSTPWSRAGARNPGPRVAVAAGSTVAPPAEPIELSGKWGDGSGDDYDDGDDEVDTTPVPAADASSELE